MKNDIWNLDKLLKPFLPVKRAKIPECGWIRAIRDALGMTSQQLATRMGVTQPRITELEQAEAAGRVTLSSLQRAADH